MKVMLKLKVNIKKVEGTTLFNTPSVIKQVVNPNILINKMPIGLAVGDNELNDYRVILADSKRSVSWYLIDETTFNRIQSVLTQLG